MGKFWFEVSGEMWREAIAKLLPLEDGTKIVEVEYEPTNDTFYVVGENDDIGAEDGEKILYVIPVMSANENGNRQFIAWHEPND